MSESTPFRYVIQLSANAMPGDMDSGQKIAFVTRSLIVEAKSHDNVENFLKSYGQFRAYYLIPAVWDEATSEPKFLVNVPVLKRQLNVFDAANVADHQIEAVAIRQATAGSLSD